LTDGKGHTGADKIETATAAGHKRGMRSGPALELGALSAPSFEKPKRRFNDPSVEVTRGRVLRFRAPIGGDDVINRSPAKHGNIDIFLLKEEITTIIVGNSELDRLFEYASMGRMEKRKFLGRQARRNRLKSPITT
jgi:hypothetical protein